MVYTNLTSEIHVKSLINCPSDKFIDSNFITDDINITTSVISFKESGYNKSIKNNRIFGDSVITTITRPTQIELDVGIILEDEEVGSGTSVQKLITQLGDYQSIGDYEVYSESDPKRRHRIALQWSDGNSTYMKIYYNAYVQSVNLSNDKTVELNMKYVVPILDIHTGSANYYEYEGATGSSILNTIDASMSWS